MTHAANLLRPGNLFHPGNWLRDWFEANKATATERHARRSVYVRTRNELQSLSDRDLADIGVSRFSIEEIAHESAYGVVRS